MILHRIMPYCRGWELCFIIGILILLDQSPVFARTIASGVHVNEQFRRHAGYLFELTNEIALGRKPQ